MILTPIPTSWAKLKTCKDVEECFLGYIREGLTFMVPSKYWSMVETLLDRGTEEGHVYEVQDMRDAKVVILCPKRLDTESISGVTVLPRNEDLAYIDGGLIRAYAYSGQSEGLDDLANIMKRQWGEAIVKGAQKLLKSRKPFAIKTDDMALMPSICAMVATTGMSVASYRGYPEIDLIFFERVDECSMDTATDSKGAGIAVNG